MKIFKLIEIDLDAERKRINHPKRYNDKQRAALNRLVDLFEEGKWQECLDHVNDEVVFPYNKEGEYPEVDHIGIQISDILRHLGYSQFYTEKQLLTEAEKIIKKVEI